MIKKSIIITFVLKRVEFFLKLSNSTVLTNYDVSSLVDWLNWGNHKSTSEHFSDLKGKNTVFKFNSLHLSTRIIIAISMLVSVIFIVQSIYSIGKNDADRIKSLDLRAQLTIATQAISLAGPLWDYDKERAKGNLRGMLEAVSYTHLTLPTICSV